MRQQRFSKIQKFGFELGDVNQCSRGYAPNGTTFNFSLYPRVDALLPDLENVTLNVRSGKRAPEKTPLIEAYRQWVEVNDTPYLIYIALFNGGYLPLLDGESAADLQAVGVMLKRSGEVVKQMQSPWLGDLGTINYIVNAFLFTGQNKPVDEHLLITKILPIDEVAMKHFWIAEIKPSKLFPASSSYVVTGEVKALRAAGVTPDAKFKFWKNAIVWTISGYPVLIALDYTGAYHVLGCDQDTKEASTAKTLIQAMANAKNIADYAIQKQY